MPSAYFQLIPNQYHLRFGAYPHSKGEWEEYTSCITVYGCNINLFTCDGSIEFQFSCSRTEWWSHYNYSSHHARLTWWAQHSEFKTSLFKTWSTYTSLRTTSIMFDEIEKSPFCLITKTCWHFQKSIRSWVSFSSPKPSSPRRREQFYSCPHEELSHFKLWLLISFKTHSRPSLIVHPATLTSSASWEIIFRSVRCVNTLAPCDVTVPADTADADRQTSMQPMSKWKENTLYCSGSALVLIGWSGYTLICWCWFCLWH